jgi:hypothetical protein
VVLIGGSSRREGFVLRPLYVNLCELSRGSGTSTSKKTTGLVVVHRPSTLALADRVALLEGGTVSAVGTHHDLLESVPAYRAILSQDSSQDPHGAEARAS